MEILSSHSVRIPVLDAKKQGSVCSEVQYNINLLNEYGVVLLRDLSLDADQFEQFTKEYCSRFYTVSNRHLRRELSGDGYSNEVVKENYALLAHTEGTFRPYPPSPEICFFRCLTPPDTSGGETILIDGVKYLEHLPADLRCRLESAGIIYEMYWQEHEWQRELSVDNVSDLQTMLQNMVGVEFTLEGNALHLFYTTQGITKTRLGQDVFATALLGHLPNITHPDYSGQRVHVKPTNRIYFGDGKEFDDDLINQLIDIHDKLSFPHRWLAGDILLIDNTRFLHGRTMTQGPCERVIVSRFGWLKPGLDSLPAGNGIRRHI